MPWQFLLFCSNYAKNYASTIRGWETNTLLPASDLRNPNPSLKPNEPKGTL